MKIAFTWNRKKYYVDDKKRPLIIAEAGVNHNGDLKFAKELIDIAKKVGADAVKFQTFHPREMATPTGASADYIKKKSLNTGSWYKLLEELTLSDETFKDLLDYCKKKGIIFLSTPYDESSADLLDDIGVPMFKIASSDTNNIPFIEYVENQ